jgi:hypothetical protein
LIPYSSTALHIAWKVSSILDKSQEFVYECIRLHGITFQNIELFRITVTVSLILGRKDIYLHFSDSISGCKEQSLFLFKIKQEKLNISQSEMFIFGF